MFDAPMDTVEYVLCGLQKVFDLKPHELRDDKEGKVLVLKDKYMIALDKTTDQVVNYGDSRDMLDCLLENLQGRIWKNTPRQDIWVPECNIAAIADIRKSYGEHDQALCESTSQMLSPERLLAVRDSMDWPRVDGVYQTSTDTWEFIMLNSADPWAPVRRLPIMALPDNVVPTLKKALGPDATTAPAVLRKVRAYVATRLFKTHSEVKLRDAFTLWQHLDLVIKVKQEVD